MTGEIEHRLGERHGAQHEAIGEQQVPAERFGAGDGAACRVSARSAEVIDACIFSVLGLVPPRA